MTREERLQALEWCDRIEKAIMPLETVRIGHWIDGLSDDTYARGARIQFLELRPLKVDAT